MVSVPSDSPIAAKWAVRATHFAAALFCMPTSLWLSSNSGADTFVGGGQHGRSIGTARQTKNVGVDLLFLGHFAGLIVPDDGFVVIGSRQQRFSGWTDDNAIIWRGGTRKAFDEFSVATSQTITSPFATETSDFPSGLKPIAWIGAACPSTTCGTSPVNRSRCWASRDFDGLLSPAVANNRPSGLNAKCETGPVCIGYRSICGPRRSSGGGNVCEILGSDKSSARRRPADDHQPNHRPNKFHRTSPEIRGTLAAESRHDRYCSKQPCDSSFIKQSPFMIFSSPCLRGEFLAGDRFRSTNHKTELHSRQIRRAFIGR